MSPKEIWIRDHSHDMPLTLAPASDLATEIHTDENALLVTLHGGQRNMLSQLCVNASDWSERAAGLWRAVREARAC